MQKYMHIFSCTMKNQTATTQLMGVVFVLVLAMLLMKIKLQLIVS